MTDLEKQKLNAGRFIIGQKFGSGSFGQIYMALDTEKNEMVAVKLEDQKLRVGRKLEFDGSTETFKGDSEANGLLTRAYRAPFVVPEKVA